MRLNCLEDIWLFQWFLSQCSTAAMKRMYEMMTLIGIGFVVSGFFSGLDDFTLWFHTWVQSLVNKTQKDNFHHCHKCNAKTQQSRACRCCLLHLETERLRQHKQTQVNTSEHKSTHSTQTNTTQHTQHNSAHSKRAQLNTTKNTVLGQIKRTKDQHSALALSMELKPTAIDLDWWILPGA